MRKFLKVIHLVGGRGLSLKTWSSDESAFLFTPKSLIQQILTEYFVLDHKRRERWGEKKARPSFHFHRSTGIFKSDKPHRRNISQLLCRQGNLEQACSNQTRLWDKQGETSKGPLDCLIFCGAFNFIKGSSLQIQQEEREAIYSLSPPWFICFHLHIFPFQTQLAESRPSWPTLVLTQIQAFQAPVDYLLT